MKPCFASYNDGLPEDSMEIRLGMADSFCLLEAEHEGEHEWTPQTEIFVYASRWWWRDHLQP